MSRFKDITLMILLALMIGVYGYADTGKWSYVDKPHKMGKVEDISIGYDGSDQYIFAAVSSDSGKLYKSTNSGLTWDWCHHVDDHWHTHVVIEKSGFDCGWTLVPSNDGHIDDDAGPYYTEDNGVTWDLKGDSLDNSKKLYALAADQSSTDLQTAYVGCEGDDSNDWDLLFKTTNAGADWFQSQSGLPSSTDGKILEIEICEDTSNNMYCIFEGDSASGVYKSINGGDTWSRMTICSGADTLQTARTIGLPTKDGGNKLFVSEKTPELGRIWFRYQDPYYWKIISSDSNWLPDGYIDCVDIKTYDGASAYFAFSSLDSNGIYYILAHVCPT